MSSIKYDYADLIAVQEIIRSAATSILGTHYACSTANYKSDGSIVTEADLAMQEALTAELAERFPEVAMLGEEISESDQLEVIQGTQDYWCLDPVDGTTNFHATMPLFSVSLGLVSQGETVLGIVNDPNRHEFFGAVKDQGFWINGEPATRPEQPQAPGNCIAFIDFKRLSDRMSAGLLQERPYKSQRNIGTCALEWAWLAAGRANLLLHGRQSIWDYSAGTLLLREAGGISETFNAEPVFKQTLEQRSVIAASNPELFEQWSARIRSFC